MTNPLSIRLVICMNDCPVGLRLERGDPLPVYQHTYDDTADGRALAEQHLERLVEYVKRNQTNAKSRKNR